MHHHSWLHGNFLIACDSTEIGVGDSNKDRIAYMAKVDNYSVFAPNLNNTFIKIT